jgi:hypothetical protein
MPIPDVIVNGFLAPALTLILLLTPLLGLATLRGWQWTWQCTWWLLLFLLVLPLGVVTQIPIPLVDRLALPGPRGPRVCPRPVERTGDRVGDRRSSGTGIDRPARSHDSAPVAVSTALGTDRKVAIRTRALRKSNLMLQPSFLPPLHDQDHDHNSPKSA